MDGRRALVLACLMRNPAAGGAAAALGRGGQVAAGKLHIGEAELIVTLLSSNERLPTFGTHFSRVGPQHPPKTLRLDTRTPRAPSMGLCMSITPQRIICKLRRGAAGGLRPA